jgi:phage I-like protein
MFRLFFRQAARHHGDMATKRTSGTAIAALTFEISDRTGKTIQLLPAGRFSSVDGRPASIAACKEWVCGPEQASAIVKLAAQRQGRMVIDYEHQTLNAPTNGQKAPAAGWFKNLEWRDGEGLFATDVEWTPAAAREIGNHEYLYISPVFEFNARTGEVQRMRMAALTNDPGLDGMQAVALSARFSSFFPTTQELQMNELLQALLTALGLDAQTPEDQVLTALNAHLAKAKSDASQVTALTAEKAETGKRIAALTAAVPDPSKYVALSVVDDLRSQLAKLTAQHTDREIDELVRAALSDGRVLPAMEGWARDLGQSNLAALRAYVDKAPKIAALSGSQTGGREPASHAQSGAGHPDATDPSLVAVCRMFGQTPADVLKVAPKEQQA